ncbi:MAG: export ABC transporter ATP-binding protein [Hadesarchaea archaeon CG08_land_8_20_14_0_20_51_8]|nr:MAG: export ABC transporter ATP-binding protein [Hadesarchaea archaeon CG08_land_8_20_14_0_20_51_8]
MSIVETRSLSKMFDGRKAVNNMNLTIEEGELFGLLGPNGAGKSTTVAMLSTILPPTEGTAIVGGYDIKKQPKEVRQIIGVVTQEAGVYDDLTAAENLAYFGKLQGVEGKKLRKWIDELLVMVQIKDRANDRVKTFSGGMKRRLNLAVGLVHMPKVLFLDEPTTGFDPQARLAVWEIIKRFQSKGVTILLTTHYMDEADYLCDRVAVMDNGKIIALDKPDALKHSMGKLETIELKAVKVPRKLMVELKKLRGVKKVVRSPEGLRLFTPSADSVLSQVVRAVTDVGVSIDSLHIAQPTLEDVFIKLTGKTLRD